MFFFPVLNPVHPSTLKAVLTASNVPKNAGLTGPYRFLKPWLGDGLLCSYGRKWERNRRLLTPAFHFDVLRSYTDVFNFVGDTFVNRIKDASANGRSFDVYPMVSRATLDTMLRCALSYEDDSVQSAESQHPYVAAVNQLLTIITERSVNPLYYPDIIFNLSPKGRKFKRLTEYVHQFSSKIIEARKKALEEDPSKLDKRHLDFLDILLTAKDENDNGLTDQEIKDEVDTFMFEGHDTTASATSWTLNSLAKYPKMQQKVRQEVETVLQGKQDLKTDNLPELQYTTYFIKEVLRVYTTVPLTTRKLSEPLTVQGITFQPGQQIDIYHHIVHKNPALWDNPEEFCPERFLPENFAKLDPFAYVPFSAGKRNCIGQNFAMNEMKILISKVVHRFRISQDPEHEAIPSPEGVMRSKNGIQLKFEEI